jgi:DinB family
MLGIDVSAPPLPKTEARLEFIKQYTEDSAKRLAVLREKLEQWWQEIVSFFGVDRSRAWVMTRRISHTSHHRGKQMAMLRMLGHSLHSNFGPTADTGGLPANKAPTIYAYPSVNELLAGESAGGAKSRLPGMGEKPLHRASGADVTPSANLTYCRQRSVYRCWRLTLSPLPPTFRPVVEQEDHPAT